jgi:hypothetical protein
MPCSFAPIFHESFPSCEYSRNIEKVDSAWKLYINVFYQKKLAETIKQFFDFYER